MSFYKKPDGKDKFQFYFCELYPDSAPENWLEDLRMLGRPFAVSPCHDQDKFEDGTPKKPHYHIILDWENTTTYRFIEKLWTQDYHQPWPYAASSPRTCFKYLTHDGWPEKYQYDPGDIRLYNGFDPQQLFKLTLSEERALMESIREYIRLRNITEFETLDNTLPTEELRYVLSKHALYFKTKVDSRRHRHAYLLWCQDQGEVIPPERLRTNRDCNEE